MTNTNVTYSYKSHLINVFYVFDKLVVLSLATSAVIEIIIINIFCRKLIQMVKVTHAKTLNVTLAYKEHTKIHITQLFLPVYKCT